MFHKKNGLLLLTLMLLPVLCMANMNGGLHISPEAILVFWLIVGLFGLNLVMTIYNIWLRSKTMRIFNIIVWVPTTVVCVFLTAFGLYPFLLVPIVHAFLIYLSARKSNSHETN